MDHGKIFGSVQKSKNREEWMKRVNEWRSKIGLKDETIAFLWSRQKDRVKRKERSCKNMGTWQGFLRGIFVWSLPIFLNHVSKMFCNFLVQLNMAKCQGAFLVFFVQKARKKWVGIKRNWLWLAASKKWLGCLHLVVVKRLANHFISKLLVQFSSKLYKL